MDIPRPPSALLAPSQATLTSLKSLYSKAARSFLQRDVEHTQQLIDNAFEFITPPVSTQRDILSSQRRKWDLLRITLETTLYTTPDSRPQSPDTSTSPSSSKISSQVRSNLLLSPPSLLATLHTRSLRLFTPPYLQPSPQYLPAQILLALVFSALKLDCPQVARGMIEEWLARRVVSDSSLEAEQPDPSAAEGYAKVIDVYCLHVLPRLHEWDYATEFLRYESELEPSHRTHLQQSLKILHIQSQTPPSPPPPYNTPLPETGGEKKSQQVESAISRPLSRASSTSSASTRTAVPATPRQSSQLNTQHPDSKVIDARKGSRKSTGLRRGVEQKRKSTGVSTPLSNELHSSSSSSRSRSHSPASISGSRASTVKASRAAKKSTNLHHAVSGSTSSTSSTTSSSSKAPTTITTTSTHNPVQDTLALIQQHYMAFRFTILPQLASKLPILVCVLLPLIALVAKLRVARSRGLHRGGPNALDEARRRLEGTSVWRSAWKAIEDAVIMAGRGLV
ncbi:hypothetical protein FRC03_009872 [Tulasnella sp. 419]|nr:hypothetical protein FRC03_009872 [Tulasnella sp. 419]